MVFPIIIFSKVAISRLLENTARGVEESTRRLIGLGNHLSRLLIIPVSRPIKRIWVIQDEPRGQSYYMLLERQESRSESSPDILQFTTHDSLTHPSIPPLARFTFSRSY